MTRIDLPSSPPADIAAPGSITAVTGQFLPVLRTQRSLPQARRRRLGEAPAIAAKDAESGVAFRLHPYLVPQDHLLPLARATRAMVIGTLRRLEAELQTRVETSLGADEDGPAYRDVLSALRRQRDRFAIAWGLPPAALETDDAPDGEEPGTEAGGMEAGGAQEPPALVPPLSPSDRDLINAIAAYQLRYALAEEALLLLSYSYRRWPQHRETLDLLGRAHAMTGAFDRAARVLDASPQASSPAMRGAGDLLLDATIAVGRGDLAEASRLARLAIARHRSGDR